MRLLLLLQLMIKMLKLRNDDNYLGSCMEERMRSKRRKKRNRKTKAWHRGRVENAKTVTHDNIVADDINTNNGVLAIKLIVTQLIKGKNWRKLRYWIQNPEVGLKKVRKINRQLCETDTEIKSLKTQKTDENLKNREKRGSSANGSHKGACRRAYAVLWVNANTPLVCFVVCLAFWRLLFVYRLFLLPPFTQPL